MKEIHIITRFTRHENLKRIEKSVFNTDKFNITWHICIDEINSIRLYGSQGYEKFLNELDGIKRKNIVVTSYNGVEGDYGHDMINRTIDNIKKGFVYILDDDNIIHPDFYPVINDLMTEYPKTKGFIFHQKISGCDFTGLDIRIASPENTHVGGIDMAQFLLSRDIIGNERLLPMTYTADGTFIDEIYTNNPDDFLFIDQALCYYNYLKPSPVFLPRILLIGVEDTKLESSFIADFEDVRLNTLCIKDDSKVNPILSDFNPDAIITIGRTYENFPNMLAQSLDIRSRWLHFESVVPNLGDIAYKCASNYILNLNTKIETPLISFFTPVYNTGEKLNRTYESIREQEYSNWEWVIVNDSTDGGTTLEIAEKISEKDPRVKVFDFKKKSGGVVGESKYRAACLCSGEYLMELDHDDYITKDAGRLMVDAFKSHPDCKFVYSDCSEINSNKESLTYGDGFSFGYGSYREEFYDGVLYKAVNQPNINPISLRHIVGVPNHFRAWERTFYHSIGGHNRRLSIADDYELIIRSFLKTRFVGIRKLLYLQYYHGSNTQDGARKDIQRRVRTIANYYNHQIRDRFEELGIEDYAYNENPHNPLLTKPRFGDKEGSANYIYYPKPDTKIPINLNMDYTI